MSDHPEQFVMTSAAMLTSSWFNIFLYATEVDLSIYYLVKKRPRRAYKWSLISALVFDGLCSAITCSNVFQSVVELNGASPKPWSLAPMIIATFATSTIVQIFLTHRYYQTVFGVIAAIWPGVKAEQFNFAKAAIIIALTFSAATDVFIAIVTLVKLRTMPTAFTSTRNLIQRVSIHAIACGMVNASASLLDLILMFNSSTGFIVIFSILGRIYTLTLLVNFILLRNGTNDQSAEIITTSSGLVGPGMLGTQTTTVQRTTGQTIVWVTESVVCDRQDSNSSSTSEEAPTEDTESFTIPLSRCSTFELAPSEAESPCTLVGSLDQTKSVIVEVPV
ncbi:hypothetical protein D9758_011416 [Tetrapyrgos nigripes]|uniref:Transmembrane protein n=1 Tax=Tetrapyrgos nigripes TaxID=182062 RepID=A0A8H5CSN3_9AGAR|nr:hypothetical protein D9758_011416 [Tetrapyrgos nigripes]